MPASRSVPRSVAAITTPTPATGRLVVFAGGIAGRSPYGMLRRALVQSAQETEDTRRRRLAPAAFLNAAFGFCLGCDMYLLIRRILPAANLEVPQ